MIDETQYLKIYQVTSLEEFLLIDDKLENLNYFNKTVTIVYKYNI